MKFHRLTTRADLFDGYKQAFTVNGTAVLLVQTEGKIYAVENKCGHFGIALNTGRVTGARIQCSQHGAEFDLSTGAVTNHVVAQCDPLPTFVVVSCGEDVGIEL